MGISQERAQEIVATISANRSGGNIKRFLTDDEHAFVMAELREALVVISKATYLGVVYGIAYPKNVGIK